MLCIERCNSYVYAFFSDFNVLICHTGRCIGFFKEKDSDANQIWKEEKWTRKYFLCSNEYCYMRQSRLVHTVISTLENTFSFEQCSLECKVGGFQIEAQPRNLSGISMRQSQNRFSRVGKYSARGKCVCSNPQPSAKTNSAVFIQQPICTSPLIFLHWSVSNILMVQRKDFIFFPAAGSFPITVLSICAVFYWYLGEERSSWEAASSQGCQCLAHACPSVTFLVEL